MAALVFGLTLVLYLAFPSTQWNFDGVACAAAVELGQPLHFFHSQHLIYGLLGFLFWHALTAVGLHMRALPALQIMTSLFSSIALVGVYECLRHQLLASREALLVTLCVATCAVVWVWSVEAQVYTLGAIGLAWGTRSLLVDTPSTEKYRAVGLWHAFAILGHVTHLLWVIPAVYWIRQECKHEGFSFSQAMLQYLVPLIATVGVAYAAVMGGIVIPVLHQHAGSVLVWLKGSAGLNSERSWAWHWPGWHSPVLWMWTNLRFFWGNLWPYDGMLVPAWITALAAVSMIGWIGLFVNAARTTSRTLLRFALLWIGVYCIFYCTWEPSTECYRVPEAIPVALIAALGVSYLKRKIRAPYLYATVSLLLIVNLTTRILPMHDSQHNAVYTETIALTRLGATDSIYLTAGSTSWMYLLYFTGRPAWNVSGNDPHSALFQAVETARGQRGIFVAASLLEDPLVAPWIRQFQTQRVAALPWLELK